jgi:leucyl aminopeptidase
MTLQLEQNLIPADEKVLDESTHILFILPPEKPSNLPFASALEAKLKRSQNKYADLLKTALAMDLPNGAMASWVALDAKHSTFKRHTSLRKAIKTLLDEQPRQLVIAIFGDEAFRQAVVRDAYYVALVNAQILPTRKSQKGKSKPLKSIRLLGGLLNDAARVEALVAGNTLCRSLTMLPPNELTPQVYRDRIAKLAKAQGWLLEEYDMKKLQKLGAGAFVAVGQGSEPQDAAIVHLSYNPKSAKKHVALVGKGICFDTGGHNLKPARYMNGMHEDMNGSAVALGILLAATESRLPVRIDCWLPIAQNHIGPKAYKQNDVVTALNGTTIEIVHTDAEGRMVLADTLTLASRAKPGLIIDFATLTGSMVAAVGTRYSGVLGNRPALLCKAVGAGAATGERVCAFPFDEDYDEDIESVVADVKQCTLDSEADHVLAARFLAKFIEGDLPWLHVDLSAVNRKGGLGAVASDISGFGVGFGLRVIEEMLTEEGNGH